MKHLIGNTDFKGLLGELIDKAISGNYYDVDYIMKHLTCESDFATTRFVDFALSLVSDQKGIDRIEYYLFNGTQIQRNYACLYLNRNTIFEPVLKAFDLGLIDEIQAYSR